MNHWIILFSEREKMSVPCLAQLTVFTENYIIVPFILYTGS